MLKLAAIILPSFVLVTSPCFAGAAQDKWIVTQLSGDARVIHPGVQPASLKINAQIVSGDTLITGSTGRAMLVRGSDYIIIAPRSELRLPAVPEATGFTRVVEKLGTMLFKIQHTGIPHFAVDTPMLAAVVKGTTFSITVDQNRSAVQVIQGAVQVTAADGGMSRLVEGGRTVFVNHADPHTLLDADKPSAVRAAPSTTTVSVSAADDNPLASVSQLTAGLVRVEANPAGVPDTTPEPVGGMTAISSVGAVPAPAAVLATSITPNGPVAWAGTPSTTAASTPTATVPTVSTPPVTVPPVTVASISTPIVTVPSVNTPIVTVPPVTVASVSTPTITVPSVNTPIVTVPPVGVASISTPTVTVPSVSTPIVTVPPVTVAMVSPTIAVPSVSTPTVTIPPVTVASISTPTITVPSVITPTVTVPSVIAPTVDTPTLTTPTVTVPSVTVPSVTTPVVTVPAITTPPVTIPSITVHCVLLC
jgi:FecR-like protein